MYNTHGLFPLPKSSHWHTVYKLSQGDKCPESKCPPLHKYNPLCGGSVARTRVDGA